MSDVPAPHIDEGIVNARRIVDGKEEWPCRCGEVHRGDYAIYDYGHHNCRHENYDLHWLSNPLEDGIWQVICAGCGNTWEVGPPRDNFAMPEGGL